jgi:CRISPR/Cas system CSM-associated protein Csm3 (group 7 of RAMP superfamily)
MQTCQTGAHIAPLLSIDDTGLDRRETFTLEAIFALEGSLLIRSASRMPKAPDAVHLSSRRDGIEQPILSGTSLAGALRARALRIARTIGDANKAEQLVDGMFGSCNQSKQDDAAASRLVTNETTITNALSLVQSSVKIDRFTGGAYPGALFSRQPVFGTAETQLQIRLTLQQPQPTQIGLLLLLLKDLWLGDLRLGGEVSVGRGCLRGIQAHLVYTPNGEKWTLTQQDQSLEIDGAKERLEQFVTGFYEEVQA